MFTMTTAMRREWRNLLCQYHAIVPGTRIESFAQEQIVTRAINADSSTSVKAVWTGRGHNTGADIKIYRSTAVENPYPLQIKSGQFTKNGILTISGGRMQRMNGNFADISEELETITCDTWSFACVKPPSRKKGTPWVAPPEFEYHLLYLPKEFLRKSDPKEWRAHGKSHRQQREDGMEITVASGKSAQVVWKFPLSLVKEREDPMVITL